MMGIIDKCEVRGDAMLCIVWLCPKLILSWTKLPKLSYLAET